MYHISLMRKEKKTEKKKKARALPMHAELHVLPSSQCVYGRMVTFAKSPMINIICPVFILGLIFYSSNVIPLETIAVMFPSQELPVKVVSHNGLGITVFYSSRRSSRILDEESHLTDIN